MEGYKWMIKNSRTLMTFVFRIASAFFRQDRRIDSTKVKDMGGHILVTRSPTKSLTRKN